MSYYIIIRGPLGCGKTTISEELSKRINAKHIAIDKVLDDNNLAKDKEEGYVSQKSFKKANEIACKEAIPILKQRTPIVFDGNFYWKSQVDDLIERLNSPHYIITLKAPIEVCIQRDNERHKTHGEIAAKEVYKKSTEFNQGITIDVTKSVSECVDEISSHLPKI